MTTEGMEEEEKRAVKKAMDLLLHKDRTEGELSERLYRAGFSEKASQTAMEYVKHYGYINDERYIRTFLEFHNGKKSRQELCYKLEQKGIKREKILPILEEYGEQAEEEALLLQLHKRMKNRSWKEIDPDETKKIIAFLSRKGYPLPLIKRAIEREKESCS